MAAPRRVKAIMLSRHHPCVKGQTGVARSLLAGRLTDTLIAATAVTHGLPVVTQDADFDRIASAHPPLRVVRVCPVLLPRLLGRPARLDEPVGDARGVHQRVVREGQPGAAP
ncbi:PIN domain-containing protein [Georgenia subflava]|uniref:PIN domain-containing protein n=1 Tax=Georgenia subflava TaxID=1622177 RepID=A0A6N7EIG3_9MICO|nr:PIN domain-containing protein [Georgenia subflava]